MVDADAQQQRTQALHQPLVLAQVLRDLARQLHGATGLRGATRERKTRTQQRCLVGTYGGGTQKRGTPGLASCFALTQHYFFTFYLNFFTIIYLAVSRLHTIFLCVRRVQ